MPLWLSSFFYYLHLLLSNPAKRTSSIWQWLHCFSISLQCRCARYGSRTNDFGGMIAQVLSFLLIRREKNVSTHLEWCFETSTTARCNGFSDRPAIYFSFEFCAVLEWQDLNAFSSFKVEHWIPLLASRADLGTHLGIYLWRIRQGLLLWMLMNIT